MPIICFDQDSPLAQFNGKDYSYARALQQSAQGVLGGVEEEVSHVIARESGRPLPADVLHLPWRLGDRGDEAVMGIGGVLAKYLHEWGCGVVFLDTVSDHSSWVSHALPRISSQSIVHTWDALILREITNGLCARARDTVIHGLHITDTPHYTLPEDDEHLEAELNQFISTHVGHHVAMSARTMGMLATKRRVVLSPERILVNGYVPAVLIDDIHDGIVRLVKLTQGGMHHPLPGRILEIQGLGVCVAPRPLRTTEGWTATVQCHWPAQATVLPESTSEWI